MGFLVPLLFLNVVGFFGDGGLLFVDGLEDLKECRMVSGKPGLCVPIRWMLALLPGNVTWNTFLPGNVTWNTFLPGNSTFLLVCQS